MKCARTFVLLSIALIEARYLPNNSLNSIHSLPLNNDATPVGRSPSDLESEEPETGPSICLKIAPSLPPCDFDLYNTRDGNSKEESSSHPERGAVDEVAVTPTMSVFRSPESRTGRTEEEVGGQDKAPLYVPTKMENIFTVAENDTAVTVVYKLEGCLPSRLPFLLPPCPSENSTRRRIKVYRLFPFRLPGVEDALIFPEIDFGMWLQLMSRLRNRVTSISEKTQSSTVTISDVNHEESH